MFMPTVYQNESKLFVSFLAEIAFFYDCQC